MNARWSIILAFAACSHSQADKLDTRPLLEAPLAYLQAHAGRPPLWSAPGAAALTDDMRIVGTGVLVGWTEQVRDRRFFHFAPSTYVFYDTASGRELWRVARHTRDSSTIVSVSPAIVILEHDSAGSVLTAYDAASGATRFTHPLPGVASVESAGNTLLAVTTRDNVAHLEALDAANGKPLWVTEQPASASANVTVVGTDMLVTAGTTTCAYAITNGGRWFCATTLPPRLPNSIPLHVAGQWILQAAGAAARADDGHSHRGDAETLALDATGAIKWHALLPETEKSLTTDGTLLFVRENARDGLAYHASAARHLVAIKAATGDVVWKSENLKEDFASEPFIENGRVYVSTAFSAWVLDLKNGKTLHHEAMPASWPRLADRIVSRGDNVVFLSETTALALSRKTLASAWSYTVRGASGSVSDIALTHFANLANEVGTLEEAKADIEKKQRGADQAEQEFERSTSEINDIVSEHRDSGVYGVAAPGLFALDAKIAAAANFKLWQAAERFSRLSVAHTNLDQSLSLHRHMLQGDYYVRPVEWLFGQGVFVLNLKTGAWHELVTSPPESFSRHFLIHFPLAIVGVDGGVLSAGIGLDERTWVTDTRFFNYNTVIKSLLAFAAVKGREAKSYAHDSLLAPDTYELMQAQ